jgi:hypothetical protein
MSAINLTAPEWQSLNRLFTKQENDIPSTYRSKLMRLGVVAEKAGRLVVTFEGRLQLRDYNNTFQASE